MRQVFEIPLTIAVQDHVLAVKAEHGTSFEEIFAQGPRALRVTLTTSSGIMRKMSVLTNWIRLKWPTACDIPLAAGSLFNLNDLESSPAGLLALIKKSSEEATRSTLLTSDD